ncbi:uncharacterized protein LOC125529875 [Triticum urartu]|uniref:uncharacterized protein LOC125529875 n=1 Tax=Triticum urartu TaxID=4572 RepID=UPI002042DC81|nr:uncharacterized protein LOC125529875 [Triticum urartu]
MKMSSISSKKATAKLYCKKDIITLSIKSLHFLAPPLLEVIYMQADSADKPTESDEKNEDFDDGLNNTYSNETTVGEAADSDEMNEYSADEVDEEQDHKRFLRLTTFSLRYDRNGDLRTGNSRRVRYYSLPQEVNDSMLEYPMAFWM